MTMTLRLSHALAAVCVSFSLFASARAHARGTQPEAPERATTVKVETLGFLGGRFGLDTEVLLDAKDSITFYAFLRAGSQEGTQSFLEGDPEYLYRTSTRGLGLDLQYRRYLVPFGGRPGTGLFVAPGFVAQGFSVSTTQSCASSWAYDNPGAGIDMCDAPTSAAHQSFGYVGPSFDVGLQTIARSGFAFSVSGGLHDRFVIGSLDTSRMPWSWGLSDGPGVRPRLRVELGWAF